MRLLTLFISTYLFSDILTSPTQNSTLPSTSENDDPYCIEYDPFNPNKCIECQLGYGPYPEDFKNSTCKKCNQTLPNCLKCQWALEFIGSEKVRTYNCMNCSFGFYPFNTTQIDAPYHFGPRCVKCPPNCIDCMTNLYCTLCPDDREIYIPPNTYFFEPYRYCRYYFEYKMMYLGIFTFIVVAAGIWLTDIFCINVNLISRMFLVSDESSRNYVAIGKLMQIQDVYIPGGRKTGRSSGSYTPKMSSIKSSRLLSVRGTKNKMQEGSYKQKDQ